MKYILITFVTLLSVTKINAGALCTPDNTTAFNDYNNRVFRISNNIAGINSLYTQCTDLSNEVFIGQLLGCGINQNPINGLGLNPTDKLLYGLSPTDTRGIGAHLELSFTNPGDVADIMQADDVKIFKIGNDGGYQDIGTIQGVSETNVAPLHQVVPIVHSAASFNQLGDLFMLAYRTNYQSSANITAGTAQLTYATPQIVIGKITNNDLVNAAGGIINTTWTDIDVSGSQACIDVMNKFRDDTNVFSTCVVNVFLTGTNEDVAVDNCLIATPILDKGIHDFAVSPLNGHFYGYDSMTYDDKDIVIDVDPMTNTASCTEISDTGNTTGVLNSLMFSKQNKLVAIFSNLTTGSWIDINNGSLNALSANISNTLFGDGSSLPFSGILANSRGGAADLIFKNGFESINDFIFANGFEGPPPPVLCIDF